MGQGPGHLVTGGAVNRLAAAGHIVETIRVSPRDPFPTEISAAFNTAGEISRQVRTALRQRRFPLVLAGNCMASLGAVAGLPPEGRGLVWLDAHSDLHTPRTSTSGFLDGMALATILGDGWESMAGSVPGHQPLPREHLLLLGTREVDPAEEESVARGIPLVRAAQLLDASAELEVCVSRLTAAAERVHLHLDLDVLDPDAVSPANPFTPAGGLSADQLLALVAMLKDRLPLASATLASYDPSSDPNGAVREAALAVMEAVTG